LGEWDIGIYPKYTKFSPDGKLLYGANADSDDQNLYILDASNYNPINKINFPNSSDYVVLSSNRDGSVIVGFSYDTNYNNSYQFHYFTNLTAPPPKKNYWQNK